jgi:hypothetical protein
MRSRVLVAVAAAAILAPAFSGGTGVRAAQAPHCSPAHGLFEDHLVTPPPVLTTAGRVLGTLHGDLNFALVNQTPSLTPTVGFYDAQSSIHTDEGDLNFSEAGSIDGVTGNFAVLQTIVGGTGRYQGATGQLMAHGNFSFASGKGQGEYEGTVCTK